MLHGDWNIHPRLQINIPYMEHLGRLMHDIFIEMSYIIKHAVFFSMTWYNLPKTSMSPLKIGLPNGKVVSQPPKFRAIYFRDMCVWYVPKNVLRLTSFKKNVETLLRMSWLSKKIHHFRPWKLAETRKRKGCWSPNHHLFGAFLVIECCAWYSSTMGTPKPSFLGVMTPIHWGPKTFIVHGFGVQR